MARTRPMDRNEAGQMLKGAAAAASRTIGDEEAATLLRQVIPEPAEADYERQRHVLPGRGVRIESVNETWDDFYYSNCPQARALIKRLGVAGVKAEFFEDIARAIKQITNDVYMGFDLDSAIILTRRDAKVWYLCQALKISTIPEAKIMDVIQGLIEADPEVTALLL